MSEAMKQRYGLVRRPWGVFYLKDKITGAQTTLKTDDKKEAQRLLNARNDAENQPYMNLSLARVYLNGADPKLGTRSWQDVMEHIVAQKTDETRRRWDTAIKDANFDCIRALRVAETRRAFPCRAERWQGVHQRLSATHSQSRPRNGMAP
jgi:hypothetical protein